MQGETMQNELTMRRAEPEEAARVLEILEDGKRSIARFGIEQWQHGYPNLSSVEADLAQGACWVAEDEGSRLVGTLALCFDTDPEYTAPDLTWLTPNENAAGEPTYAAIHRCATAAEALERGVMGFMFKAAEGIAAAAGRRSIRVDTHPGNRAMRSFLARQGFTELAPFDLKTKDGTETDLTRIAYEKLVG